MTLKAAAEEYSAKVYAEREKISEKIKELRDIADELWRRLPFCESDEVLDEGREAQKILLNRLCLCMRL